jgi:hypothetical protein
MKTGEQMHIKEGLEVHHMRIHMNAVTVIGLVLVEGVMKKEEVLDMIKKVGNLVILGEVLLVLRLLMIGAEMIDLEMGGNSKTVGNLVEILNSKADHLSDLKM